MQEVEKEYTFQSSENCAIKLRLSTKKMSSILQRRINTNLPEDFNI